MAFPAIDNVLTLLETMEKQLLSDNIFRQVQTLVQTLPDAIDEIRQFKKSKQLKPFVHKTKLCASQLSKALPLLISSVTTNAINPAFKDITEFLTEKIRWCLLEVLRVFRGSSTDSDREPSGIFVSSMDYAINYVHNDETINDEFKNLIDDLLCQSLTIAKLSSPTDYQEIVLCCKNVLVRFAAMRSKDKQMSKSMNKDMLLSSLEGLERKINIAVLRMYLHVMSEPSAPVKSFVSKCFGKKPTPRVPSDLNPDTVEMDYYCDQIQTIGNFAVACTDNCNTKLKVQCCLASLEFIENYFIPTATAFYIDSNNIVKRNFFKFLAEEIQTELKNLQLLLDNIIDTTAFIQVTHDDLSCLIQVFKDSIFDGIYNKKEAETFLFRCYRLMKHLHTTDDNLIKDNDKVKEACDELEKPLFSLQLKVQQADICNPTGVQSIVQDMESVIFCVNKISLILNKTDNFSFSFTSVSRARISRQNYSTDSLLSLSNIEIDEDHKAWVKSQIEDNGSELNMSTLEPYLVKVAETPRKLTLFVKTPSKFTPCHPKVDSYSSYNVTDVLDQLSGLSDTFFETDRSGKKPNNVRLAEAFGLFKDTTEMEKSCVSGSDSESYDTVMRLEDINFLDGKLSNLKTDV